MAETLYFTPGGARLTAPPVSGDYLSRAADDPMALVRQSSAAGRTGVPAYDAGQTRRDNWDITDYGWYSPARLERYGTTHDELSAAFNQLSDADKIRAQSLGPAGVLRLAGAREAPAPGGGFSGASPRDPVPERAPVLPAPPPFPSINPNTPPPAPATPPAPAAPTPLPSVPMPSQTPSPSPTVQPAVPSYWDSVINQPTPLPPGQPTVGRNPYLGNVGGFGAGTPPYAPFSSWGFYPMPHMAQYMPGSFGMATPGMGSWYTPPPMQLNPFGYGRSIGGPQAFSTGPSGPTAATNPMLSGAPATSWTGVNAMPYGQQAGSMAFGGRPSWLSGGMFLGRY